MNLNNIIEQFQISGGVKKIEPLGNGHIHATYRVENRNPNAPDYVLQRINRDVFKNTSLMMENIRQVTEYLKRSAPGQLTLTLIPANDEKSFYKDAENNDWRVYIFLKDLVSHDVAETPEQIYEGAKAFGRFLRQLKDFPASALHPAIPDFHNVISRLEFLREAVRLDVKNRVGQAAEEIEYIRGAAGEAGEMCKIQKIGEAGAIPLRVTHNDTKLNNVLLGKDGKGACVIDLDTVMPGFVHYDFGDGVRTTISAAPEDEVDLHKIQADLTRFRAFAEGYLEGAHAILTTTEIQYLSLSGAMLAYIMGVRFLTDFLAGDVYYKTRFEGHNLQRARAQLDLSQKIMTRLRDMETIVQNMTDS